MTLARVPHDMTGTRIKRVAVPGCWRYDSGISYGNACCSSSLRTGAGRAQEAKSDKFH